jgi:hypothetical protein
MRVPSRGCEFSAFAKPYLILSPRELITVKPRGQPPRDAATLAVLLRRWVCDEDNSIRGQQVDSWFDAAGRGKGLDVRIRLS